MANDCVNVGYQMFFGKGAKLLYKQVSFIILSYFIFTKHY